MIHRGQEFLDNLANFPPRTFENNFSKSAIRLGLGTVLESDELQVLFEAALRAAFCNIALNGRGGCDGQVIAERELHRIWLEHQFMEARNDFMATMGWASLPPQTQLSLERIFLTVHVEPENLAF